VLDVYFLTAAFPKQEFYGRSVRIRRAAVSIPANIAEGFRRRGKADKARFLNIAADLSKNVATISFSPATLDTETPKSHRVSPLRWKRSAGS
jgi:hypothetical protein